MQSTKRPAWPESLLSAAGGGGGRAASRRAGVTLLRWQQGGDYKLGGRGKEFLNCNFTFERGVPNGGGETF